MKGENLLERHLKAAASAMFSATLLLLGLGDPTRGDQGTIRPSEQNPWYWQYQGRPLLLLGGGKDDNLFQLPDLQNHLNELADTGVNYIRNVMSARITYDFEVFAFRRLENGKYDLDQWNDEYWIRFANMLRWTHERGIVVQIEVWDRFDYSRGQWKVSPWNPANNVNYTFEQSGFAREYPEHPGKNVQPFFFTTPQQRNNEAVLTFQRRFVEKLLEQSLPYPHVLYCIDNESGGEEAWAVYWADFIRDGAQRAGTEACVTQMWSALRLDDPIHRRTFDHPQRYCFVDISQVTHQRGQEHWDQLLEARESLGRRPRPMNSVKIYGEDGGRYGNSRDGIERWWRQLIGGAASVRFHRPSDPDSPAWGQKMESSVRSSRKLAALVNLWDLVPANELLRDRDPNEVYATARPGDAYALYFPDGGDVELDLRRHRAEFELRWIDINTAKETQPAMLSGGRWVRLRPPSSGHWAAAIIAH